ncbi:hypothetical protein V5O48_000616 [Marasmius crinis-equi]|uniref:Uncharacterized protein n=1 Tax=Marasmius crinis-equi TaxID=585013 RepID=A0ABR3G1M2_9AGAR
MLPRCFSTEKISSETFILREVTLDEIDAVAVSMAGAFLNDRTVAFFSDATQHPAAVNSFEGKGVFCFYRHLIRSSLLSGGRAVIAVTRCLVDGFLLEQISGAAVWLAPKRRVDVWRIPMMINSGALNVVRHWGMSFLTVGFIRIPPLFYLSML